MGHHQFVATLLGQAGAIICNGNFNPAVDRSGIYPHALLSGSGLVRMFERLHRIERQIEQYAEQKRALGRNGQVFRAFIYQRYFAARVVQANKIHRFIDNWPDFLIADIQIFAPRAGIHGSPVDQHQRLLY